MSAIETASPRASFSSQLSRRRAAPLERPHAKPRQEPLLEYAREVLKDWTMQQ